MSKLLLITSLIVLSPLAHSQFDVINRVNETMQSAGSAPSGECHSCRIDASPDEIALPTTRPRSGNRQYFNPKCKKFIADNGSYGPWGTVIKDYIIANGGANSRFFSNALPGMESAPHTCPNWGSLSENEKMKFWVWMMASIAQVESSCDETKVNTGPVRNANDRPRGLFQLNSLKSQRSWRGDNCKFPSNNTTPSNHIKCSLDIMDELLKGRSGEYESNGKIFPTNSYWEKLRSNHSSTGGPIGQLVRKYPPCGATP